MYPLRLYLRVTNGRLPLRQPMKSSPRVKSGRQYCAIRSAPAAPDHNSARTYPQIFRKHPGLGHRHVLLVRHVREFLEILPQWRTLAIGLNAILLAPARPGCDGFHRPGLVAICAQPRNLCQLVTNPQFVRQHATLGLATSTGSQQSKKLKEPLKKSALVSNNPAISGGP